MCSALRCVIFTNSSERLAFGHEDSLLRVVRHRGIYQTAGTRVCIENDLLRIVRMMLRAFCCVDVIYCIILESSFDCGHELVFDLQCTLLGY